MLIIMVKLLVILTMLIKFFPSLINKTDDSLGFARSKNRLGQKNYYY